jgi:hypothetical protein
VLACGEQLLHLGKALRTKQLGEARIVEQRVGWIEMVRAVEFLRVSVARSKPEDVRPPGSRTDTVHRAAAVSRMA